MKKLGIVYYISIILLLLIAYIMGFGHQILGYGGHTLLFAFLNLIGPVVLVGLSIIFFIKYRSQKKQTVVFLSVINLCFLIGYMSLWVISVVSMWSI